MWTSLLLCSCTMPSISGKYASCAGNCNYLTLNADSSYFFQFNPEIGKIPSASGIYSVQKRKTILTPKTNTLCIDGIEVKTEYYPTADFKIRRNKLYPTFDGKKHRCYYYKITDDSIINRKHFYQNKLRCLTNNPIQRVIYRLK